MQTLPHQFKSYVPTHHAQDKIQTLKVVHETLNTNLIAYPHWFTVYPGLIAHPVYPHLFIVYPGLIVYPSFPSHPCVVLFSAAHLKQLIIHFLLSYAFLISACYCLTLHYTVICQPISALLGLPLFLLHRTVLNTGFVF